MAKVFQSYRFTTANPYTDDMGTVRQLTARFAVPPDMTPAIAIGLAAQAGGVAVLPTDPKGAACPDAGVKGRKLTFIRQDGNSISFTMGDRLTLIAQATGMRATIDALTGTNPVVCIKLDGEYYPNLFDELAPAAPGPRVPGISSRPPAPATKQYQHFGTFSYLSDAIYGTTYQLPFKIASNLPANAAPAEYDAFLSAAGVIPVATSPCPGSDPRIPRRFLVQSVVNQNAAIISQTAEIPVAGHLPASILAIGQQIAAATSTQCVGYRGESNSRFHRLT